ncbi:MAG: cytochrome-c peroxidase [Polyangiales bacterium]
MQRLSSVLFLVLVVSLGCGKKSPTDEPSKPAPTTAAAPTVVKSRADTEPLKPLPESVDVNMDKVLLGRALFHDGILSRDGKVKCVTCHQLDKGGAEFRKTSLGIDDQEGPINSPSMLNAAYNLVQFWDGRAKDLTEQGRTCRKPEGDGREMGRRRETRRRQKRIPRRICKIVFRRCDQGEHYRRDCRVRKIVDHAVAV